ncbi:ABC transporter ATP-binding protein [Nocardioides anomalus]|uniref:ABC transporter ATP-binding protein n=1 Tax=Nocardioides anomalus TaxID=2712223 RepID=A0A6G6WHK8_9ACTN|nr:ABC transporter ATP-binding protein [Nocardioides anomalus]QIG44633.1 ABC transporter ATP-binding protein [Nocardioides anomalus]
MTTTHPERPAQDDPMAAAPVLEVQDVAVHYGGVKAVDGVTLTMRPGLIYGIIGPNGSGKSTLIGAITRMTKLTRGDVLIDGSSYRRTRPHKLAALGVARTFQTVRLLPDLDVRRNIQLGADTAGRGGGDVSVAEVIERTGLTGMEEYFPSELSYGTQRRVEIARALVMGPRLLLLDEPTAGMNQTERAEISELMQGMRGGGLCQLLVEHDVQMMVDTCDYVYAMTSGRLIAEGTPTEVVQNPLVQEAYLGRKWRNDA